MKTIHRLLFDDLVCLVFLLGVALSALALMRVERQWSAHLKEAGLARISFVGPHPTVWPVGRPGDDPGR